MIPALRRLGNQAGDSGSPSHSSATNVHVPSGSLPAGAATVSNGSAEPAGMSMMGEGKPVAEPAATPAAAPRSHLYLASSLFNGAAIDSGANCDSACKEARALPAGPPMRRAESQPRLSPPADEPDTPPQAPADERVFKPTAASGGFVVDFSRIYAPAEERLRQRRQATNNSLSGSQAALSTVHMAFVPDAANASPPSSDNTGAAKAFAFAERRSLVRTSHSGRMSMGGLSTSPRSKSMCLGPEEVGQLTRPLMSARSSFDLHGFRPSLDGLPYPVSGSSARRNSGLGPRPDSDGVSRSGSILAGRDGGAAADRGKSPKGSRLSVQGSPAAADVQRSSESK